MLDIEHKIKKLLALSESPNVHEARLAAAKAQRLMTQFQIEIDPEREPEDFAEVSLGTLTAPNGWRCDLATLIASKNLCRVVCRPEGDGWVMLLVGRGLERRHVLLLYTYLRDAIEREAREAYGQDPLEFSAFALGAAFGLRRRITEAKRRGVADVRRMVGCQVKDGDGKALARIVSTLAERGAQRRRLDRWVTERYRVRDTSRMPSVENLADFGRGVAFGSRLPVDPK